MRIAKRLVVASYVLSLPLGLALLPGCDGGGNATGTVEPKIAPLTPDQQKAKDAAYPTGGTPKKG